MNPEDKNLLDETYEEGKKLLDFHHRPGFGIFPSADPKSNYFNQVWARDAAHATAHYFARENPQAVIDSLQTFFTHQRPDGSLPSRVERQYQMLRLTPVLRYLSNPAFYVIENKIRKRIERPVHEGGDSAGGEDTIPAVLIMAGELFDASEKGKVFIKEHFENLHRAAAFFLETKIDATDGLAVMTRDNPDWADTITRKGKLGLINIWWWRGLQHLEEIAQAVGDQERFAFYHAESEKVKKSIMEKIYDAQGYFFRAKALSEKSFSENSKQDIHRLDTAASIFGAGYFLDADAAFWVEQTLKQRVGHASGLQNFDPPYAQKDIFWAHRWMGQWLYHNKFVWPWITLQNIYVKIKIAREHSDPAIRVQYQEEAVGDLLKMARLFKKAGGAYEVFEPDESRRGETAFYKPPKNFMGTLTGYQGAYARLKKLGWI
jgi:hypothetical protein